MAEKLERLKKIVAWAYEKSAFYQKSFQKHGVAPEDIQSLADVEKLPLLTREEIRGNEFEILTLPLSSIVRVAQCDGITKFYTKGDIQNGVEIMTRCFMAAGVLRGSIVGIAGDLSDSRILDAINALESIGATVILREVKNIGVDTVISTAPKGLTVSKTFPQTKIFNLHAPPELGQVFLYQDAANYYFQEEHFLIESLAGELVITTLTAQAQPLIRFRTGRKL